MRRFCTLLDVSAWIMLVLELALALLYTFSCQRIQYFWDEKVVNGHCSDKGRILADLVASIPRLEF